MFVQLVCWWMNFDDVMYFDVDFKSTFITDICCKTITYPYKDVRPLIYQETT